MCDVVSDAVLCCDVVLLCCILMLCCDVAGDGVSGGECCGKVK